MDSGVPPIASRDVETSSPQTPDLTVVIPAHDEAPFITGALESVLGQRWTRDRIEVVVVANGCTDDTAGMVRSFSAAHPDLRVRLIELAEAGVGNARNAGARSARAPLLIFMDADARMTPYVVARAVKLDRSGVAAATYRMLADSRDLLDRGFFWYMELITVLRGVRTFNFYCRRDVFLAQGGFDPTIRVAEVIDLFKRFGEAGIGVEHVPTVILTSPRRIRKGPLRIGLLRTTVRWALASRCIGRSRRY